MQVKTDELKYAISKAHEIRDIHRLNYLNSDETEKSLPNLLDLCQCYLGKNIVTREHKMQHDGQPMRGFCLSFNDGHYEIVLLGGQNNCWKRLVLCKELFHVILDEEKYQDKSISNLIDEAAITFPDPDSHPKLPLVAEMLAEIAAIEFLFPYEDRKKIIAQLNGNTPDYGDIAKRYKIPRVYVESYLKPKIMTTLSTIA
jgi:Zn-dependent peptidase ImmA (M78 family)